MVPGRLPLPSPPRSSSSSTPLTPTSRAGGSHREPSPIPIRHPPPPPSSSPFSFAMSRRSVSVAHTIALACLLLFAVASFQRVRYAVSSSSSSGADRSSLFLGDDTVSIEGEASSSSSVSESEEAFAATYRRHVSSVLPDSFTTDSILWPDWQVLVVVSAGGPALSDPGVDDGYSCLYRNNVTSPARPAWVLPSTNQTTFICELPEPARRRRVILQPALIRSPRPDKSQQQPPPPPPPEREVLLWNFLTYESLSTADDVVLFAKGVNHRQGHNHPPSDLNCVFISGGDVAAKTAVTVSEQEVFRCHHPPRSALPSGDGIKVSIEIVTDGNVVVPTLAQYAAPSPPPEEAAEEVKALICACTMVFNAAKFLKEWVMYHSSIGIERFILYDNGSEDDLGKVIQDLREQKYDVRSLLWPWQKTQEAGFSHSALYARDSCTWMSYIDVDEFIFSPSWLNSSYPSKGMLKSLLPRTRTRTRASSSPFSLSSSTTTSKGMLSGADGHRLRPPVGEVSIQCNEFGPSEQRAHPKSGVTQGYTCRRRQEQRHKSIVRLDAVHESLLNVIHHFQVKEGYRTRSVGPEKAVVNHYKYQAWPEFKAKFRRRVSAYVVDWRQAVNPGSKDRTPGLGFEAVEPRGWPYKFCEVWDDRLKNATERWFGSPAGMAWQ